MIGAVARKLFGSSNERRIRGYRPRVEDGRVVLQRLRDLGRRGAVGPKHLCS